MGCAKHRSKRERQRCCLVRRDNHDWIMRDKQVVILHTSIHFQAVQRPWRCCEVTGNIVGNEDQAVEMASGAFNSRPRLFEIYVNIANNHTLCTYQR